MFDKNPKPDPSTDEMEEAILDLIAKEVETNPGSVLPFTQGRLARAMAIVEGVVVDDDEELPDDVTF